MQLNLSENYTKILKKIPAPSTGFVLKILAYLAALIYWGIILLGTFSLLN
tara:strand:- start:272 stop:421 length:150 start_codon:yes stop_codon:yes gene_type:complete